MKSIKSDLGTLHVVTAFVLLYRTLAVRTGFAVSDEPQEVGSFLSCVASCARVQLVWPHLCYLSAPTAPLQARCRGVCVVQAFPARTVYFAQNYYASIYKLHKGRMVSRGSCNVPLYSLSAIKIND